MSENNGNPHVVKKTKADPFQSHDYYNIDALLEEDHILARDAVRAWVKQEVSPVIEDYSERAECPHHLFKGLGRNWCFWTESSCRIWRWWNG